MAKTETVRRATGRDQAEWYTLLDTWGAPGKPFREIVSWLTDEHGLSRWWAQKLIVEYEQDRGLRSPGARPDGTFEVGASKTIGVPIETLFRAFVDPRGRRRWFPEASMRLQASKEPESARFKWTGGTGRVTATFSSDSSTRRQKSTVNVVHGQLTSAAEAQQMKETWRSHLSALKTLLES